MKLFLSICILLIINIYAFSQNIEKGLPGLKNFSPKDYGQECQNYSVVQDSNMLMYFSNSRGIMEFDNTNWTIVKTNGIPKMGINSKNEIFFGSYNQIGKVIYKEGNLDLELFKNPKKFNLGQIKKVIAFDNKVYFSNDRQLYVYADSSLNLELCCDEGLEIFEINKKLLTYIPEKGLSFWGKNGFELNNDLEFIKDIKVQDIIQIDSKDFIIKPLNEKGFYFYKDNKFSRFCTEADEFIYENIYSCAKILNNNQLLIGTIHGGLVCIDKYGRYVYSINRDNGLKDNQITDICVDKNGSIWLTTFNGISLVSPQSNISFFNASYGLNGNIASIIRFKGTLYVGTTNGLFKVVDSKNYDSYRNVFDLKSRFKKYDEIRAVCWEMYIINDVLYAVTGDGLYYIKENSAIKVLDGKFKSILALRNLFNTYLLASEKGLLAVKILNQEVDTIGYLKNITSNVRTLVEDNNNNIWIGTDIDGVFKTKIVNGIVTEATINHYSEKEGLPKGYYWVDVFKSTHGILFSTSKGVYNYNYKNNIFQIDSLLEMDFSNDDKHLYPIVEDNNNNIWYSCIYEDSYKRETGVLLFKKENEKYTLNNRPYSQLNEYVIETIYPEGDSVVWFGTSDALIKLTDINQSKTMDKFPCMIRKVSFRNNSVIKLAPNSVESFTTKYSNKTLRFYYTAISYTTIGKIEYQVMLEGFDKNWSEWTDEAFKEYTFLNEGVYTFKVKARDIFGNESKEASIAFYVKPPIYRTVYAYILYIILFASSIYLALKYNGLRHVRERYKLEKIVETRTNELAQQKERVESLIKKLLPQNAMDEIQETGNAKSEKYDMVTVLFADIQKFTEIAERTNTEELIKHLNHIFGVFDKLISKYNIQKIKTIGDAYMCAGGMPNKDNTNSVEVILAGLEMQRAIKSIGERNTLKLEMRVGVHTGSVVAGVVGESKIEYDIWGDTVNIASRMESHGFVDKVNVSYETYNEAEDFFDFQPRGKIDVKYKGEMKMFFVDKIKKDLSDDGYTPNKKFHIKLQNIRYKMIEEEILAQLQANLPTNLYYHNVKHTIDVIFIVAEIANKEGVNDEEMLLLKCSALFHDTGFMVTYDNNEEVGVNIATQTLKKYKFSDEQIQTVKRLILSTKMPHNPKDLLEKIICDADLDYLGRPDFIPISQNLFRELFERGKVDTITQWNKMQYRFIRDHNYFTETARKKQEQGKLIVLKELEEII